jgi:hypothetical protein
MPLREAQAGRFVGCTHPSAQNGRGGCPRSMRDWPCLPLSEAPCKGTGPTGRFGGSRCKEANNRAVSLAILGHRVGGRLGATTTWAHRLMDQDRNLLSFECRFNSY